MAQKFKVVAAAGGKTETWVEEFRDAARARQVLPKRGFRIISVEPISDDVAQHIEQQEQVTEAGRAALQTTRQASPSPQSGASVFFFVIGILAIAAGFLITPSLEGRIVNLQLLNMMQSLTLLGGLSVVCGVILIAANRIIRAINDARSGS
jgi:hypothetical protein